MTKYLKMFLGLMLIGLLFMPLSAFAEETPAATLVKSDNTTVNYESVQAAIDAAENGEIIKLLNATDEVLNVTGKAVGVVYNEFGEPKVDVQCLTSFGTKSISGKYYSRNAFLIGDLESCVLLMNSGNNTSSLLSNIDAICTTIEESAMRWYHFRIYKDVKLTQDLVLPAYQGCGTDVCTQADLEFDLNGHTIDQTVGINAWNNYAALTVLSKVTLKDSSSSQSGKVVGAAYGINVEVNGELILESGTISTKAHVYSNNIGYAGSVIRMVSGCATLKGGTVTAVQDAAENGKLVSAIIVYDDPYTADAAQAKLIVEGGTIEGVPAEKLAYEDVNPCIYDYYGAAYVGEVQLYGGVFSDSPWPHYPAPGYIVMKSEKDEFTVYPTYQIEHYIEKLDGTYELKETDLGSEEGKQDTSISTLAAPLNSVVTAAAKDYSADHLVYNSEKSTSSGAITKPVVEEDGSVSIYTLKMYYDLDTFEITFDPGEHGSLKDDAAGKGNFKYGEAFPAIPEVETTEYYEFDGWYLGDNKIEDFPATVSEDVTYIAHWKENDVHIRISGVDRYETSIKIADQYKTVLGIDRFETVIVASGEKFPDALSGTYLAYLKKAPIVLVTDKKIDFLLDYLSDNLSENGKIYILGGSAAVSETIEEAISQYDTKRLAGPTRYETNIEILKEANVTEEEIVVCTGVEFADGLSAAALKKPILLVNDKMSSIQTEYLQRIATKKYHIIGGEKEVNESIAEELLSYGDVNRISGESRYKTTIAVAEEFYKNATGVVIAIGDKFADGLSGGMLAAELNIPIILSADKITEDAKNYLDSKELQRIIVLGGTGAISDESVEEIFGSDIKLVVK